jgi:hypothetical protein
VQYTIESRQLTSEYTQRPSYDIGTKETLIEAVSADDAISEFVRLSDSELVSLARPGQGHEAIATVKKQDLLFLVRVYAA